MQYILSAPAALHADISLPASKSISNRALILHALARGRQPLHHLSDCDDTRVMVEALQGNDGVVDILAAGTAMRFLTAYFCVTPGTRILTGTQRMRQRPIGILVEALRSLGARIDYVEQDGFPPLRVTGAALQGSEVTLAGNVSSQYISALLMVGTVLPGGLRLTLEGNIVSRPYIDLTLRLMRDFGAQAEWVSEDCIRVYPGGYKDVEFTVESDWSAASYWYEMVALAGRGAEVSLHGLFAQSYQGDSRGAELFSRLGVRTAYTAGGVRLSYSGNTVERLEEDLVDIPDLAQTFVVTCCLLGVPFRFTGLQSLKIKETDRIEALKAELRKLGYIVRSEHDSVLSWEGERCEPCASPVIRTYEDHRMAMAFAPASLRVPGLCIAEPQVVSKSYPAYWQHLQAAGFLCKEAACPLS